MLSERYFDQEGSNELADVMSNDKGIINKLAFSGWTARAACQCHFSESFSPFRKTLPAKLIDVEL